jgi:glycosyltransferase involved in cell wall biosynthesis
MTAAGRPLGLSVFFPADNDGGTIASLIVQAVKAVSSFTPGYGMIVVNDGSADSTAAIADEMASMFPSQFLNFRRVAKTAVDVARLWFELVVRRRHLRDGRTRAAVGPVTP